MKKKEVQQRILQNGKPLALDKFSWDEKTRAFSTEESDLVIDFSDVHSCTFKTEYNCVFNTGSNCAFNTGSGCTFNTECNCTFKTGSTCTFKTEYNCVFNTGSNCAFNTGSGCAFNTECNCTFNTWASCTFKTEYNCVFNTGSNCAFNTGFNCAFNTECNCTFKTGSTCTFKTWADCAFQTEYNCAFSTECNCTFKTGSGCVILRIDTDEIIPILSNELTLAPSNIKGYISKCIYSETGKPSIVADRILSEIISERETKSCTVYKVTNYGETKISYLIEADGIYSHGATLKEAKDSLKYKISDRDTTKYNDYTQKTELTEKEALELYRTITGACESGTRDFVESLESKPKKLTVKELVELTKGQYNHRLLVEYFAKGEVK